jgi:hypothetical protein
MKSNYISRHVELVALEQQIKRLNWATIGLGVVLVLAALLRLYHLDTQSLWVDEIIQMAIARRGLIGHCEQPSSQLV